LGLLLVLLIFGLLFTLLGAHGFLSVSAPVEASVLVVEGWLPDYALAECKDAFEQNGYDQIITTGGPLEEGFFLSEYATYAELGAATLQKLGLKSAAVQAAPAQSSRRNRTYTAALGLRTWLRDNASDVRSVNVVSLGVHARRSRLMYAEALGPDHEIGIIALPDRDYEPETWWRYSAGIKGVITEGIAYLHAKLLFDPQLEHDPALPETP